MPNCNNWLATPTYGSAVNIGQLNITGNQLTIEAEFYQTAYNTTQSIFGSADLVGKYTDPSNDNYLLRADYCSITTDQGFFQTPAVTGRQLDRNYQVAMVYDGDSLKYYQNGCEASSIAASGNLIQNSFDTRIGFYAYQYWDVQFYGYINEVRIWNVARTSTQINEYSNTTLPNPTTQTGLLAYYTFDNLLNKQGNPAWNGILAGAAQINQTDPSCAFTPNQCQVPASDSIIINDYTEVLEYNICKNELIVADATKYNPGDTVMIIQMKGAVIDSSNTASFGNILDYKNSGNYEMNIVKAKNGNTLLLLNALQRQYDIPNGKVQLIRVPYYRDAVINSTLTCLPWDGGKGGVVVLNAQNSVTLNANIDVTGRGFSGGRSPNPQTTTLYCSNNDYYYAKGDLSAAEKGESIASISDAIAWGKGSPANGGGGGNGHNAGGGGGANGGAGGFGGYQLDACGGPIPDNRGLGGKLLNYNTASNKVFLGGGGGSGHTDNAGGSPMWGGNGGGIVIIISPAFTSDGNEIIARGGDAPECNLTPITLCHDGSGGGGGGGSVLLNNIIISDATKVDVSGGKGGDLVIYAPPGGTKIGPGGGGGAGVVWANGNALPANLTVTNTGGVNGVIIEENNDPYGTTPGQPGINVFSLKIPVDTTLFKLNIDSVKIRDSVLSCAAFNFQGMGYTNEYAISGWKWNFGDGDTSSSQNINHIYSDTGTYSVKLTVTDLNGCQDSITTNVRVTSFNITKSNDTAICAAYSVALFVSGGTSYSWTPAASLSNPDISNPVAYPTATTTYYVTVNNGTGCTKTDSIKVTVNPLPFVTKSNDTSACNNTLVSLFATGGSSYLWSPAGSLNNPNIRDPTASPPSSATTTYYVTVTDSAGCSKTDSVRITTSTPPVISVSQDQSICTNTSIQLFASGGGSYLWSPASSLSKDMIANPLASPPGPTTYYVTVTNSQGCAKTDSVSIGIYPKAIIAVSHDTTICNNASAYLFALGGASYLWSPASSLNNASIPDPVASPAATTTYHVSINDIHNCNYQDSVTVSVLPPVVFTISADTSVCLQSSAQLSASGGDTYLWSPAQGLNNPNISNPTATPQSTTTYTVTIHENTCNKTATLSTNITVNPIPDVTATSSNNLTCSIGSSQLNASGASSYMWQPPTGLNNPDIANPVASPDVTTLYTVTGTDANGCTNTDTVSVKTDYGYNGLYLLPNSFTPNGDGINDCFGIKYWGRVDDLDFRIYNRFGEMVFHTTDPNACWDGTYHQIPQQSDVFVYVIKARTACGIVDRKGTVTLLR